MRRRRDTTFGGRVRLLREDAELTQDQVTDALAALGVTIGRSYISEIERSKKMPNGEVIAGLARVLRTTADYLLCLSESPDAPGDAAPVAGMSAEADEIARIVDALQRIQAAVSDERANLDRLREAIDDEQARGNHADRLGELIANGFAMLDTPDVAAANAWLRQRVRVWTADNVVTEVEWL